jgi:hypothetical protein
MSREMDRLDSWKAIAEYLRRDERTLRRWEKQGLPVRRMADAPGHSVFAYKSEIDEWLRATTRRSVRAQTTAVASEVHTPPTPPGSAPRRTFWRQTLAAIAIITLALSWTMLAPVATGQIATAVLTQTGVTALDDRGAEVWRHTFPADQLTLLSESVAEPTQVMRSAPAGVYALTSYVVRRSDSAPRPGTLWFFGLDGKTQQSFSFDDRWTFADGQTYAGPWPLTDFRADDRNGRRVAVAAHHLAWWPSVVTLLNEQGQRQGTFVHSGWVESLRWIDGDRIAIAGFSNSRDAGMMAVLDARLINGASPEERGSPYGCVSCPAGQPVFYVVFPRTELNLVTGSGFNRAAVFADSHGTMVRTSELDRPDNTGALTDVLYRFDNDLRLIESRFSDRYWDKHRQLQLEGRISHARAECPDRNGPQPIQAWTPSLGWRKLTAAR